MHTISNTKIKVAFTLAVAVLLSLIAASTRIVGFARNTIAPEIQNRVFAVSYEYKYARATEGSVGKALWSLLAGFGGHNGAGDAPAIPVFVYHGIVKNPDRFSMTPETFSEQLFALKRAGFQTVTVQDVIDYVAKKKPLPPNSFLLTFDDGRRDSWVGADPILKALNFTAVMFTVTIDSLPADGKTSAYYLNENDLKQMVASGRWEIESHGIQDPHASKVVPGFVPIDAALAPANFLSNRMWLVKQGRLETEAEYEQRLHGELAGSRKLLEDTLGISVKAFAYPFGDYGQQSVNNKDNAVAAIRAEMDQNYAVSFHQIWPIDHEFSWNYPGDNPQRLRRIEPSPDWSGTYLVRVVSNGAPKPLPYTDMFEENNGWKSSWGLVSVESGALKTAASEASTGSFTFLDGTWLWKDYLYAANVDWTKGETFAMGVRFRDELNYADCLYSDGAVSVEQFINNNKTILATVKNGFPMPKQAQFAVLARGRIVGCYVNGNLVAEAETLDSFLSTGGVAFKTWDHSVNNTAVSAADISIVPVSGNGSAELAALYHAPLPSYMDVPPIAKLPKPGVPAAPKSGVSQPGATSTPVAPIELADSFTIPDFSAGPAWTALSGTLAAGSDIIAISTDASSTAAFAVLPGTASWADYVFTATIDWNRGRNAYVVARFADSKNYVMCSLTNYGSSVNLYQVKNGAVKTVGRSPNLPIPTLKPWADVSMGIKVAGNEVSCIARGDTVLTYTLPSMPKAGGIGLKVADPQANNASLTVKSISVEAAK